MMTERRYSDEEFALILRRAASMGAREQTARGGREGLTLDELKAIASEVGLDPEAVAQAARSLPTAREGHLARLFGGPAYFEVEFEVERVITPEDTARTVAAIRRVLRSQGASQWTGGGMEWTSTTTPTQVSVDIVPRGDRTRVFILADRGGMVVVSAATSLLVFLVMGGALVRGLEPTGVLEAIGVATGAAAGAFATARAIWASTARRTRARIARLVDDLSAALGARP